MTQVRILIVSQYYYPEPVEKVHDLARGLVKLGHDVEVLTGFPCYPLGKIYTGHSQRVPFVELIEGVTVHRVPQFPDHSRSAVRRALYYLSFAASAAVLGPVVTKRPDVMLVYLAALPVGVAGRYIAFAKRAPYILDVVDLWPESVVASGLVGKRKGRTLRALRFVAKFVYSGATHIGVVTDGFRSSLERMGVPGEKVSVIHNWMPRETYRASEHDAELAGVEGLAGRFVVMYAGNMGQMQGLATVVEAGALVADDPDVVLALVGDGTERHSLERLAAELGLDNVRFLGRRDPADMPALYAIADILLVHLNANDLADMSIPSKTFAYMASGRPVLVAVRGEAARFVTANGFGQAVEPSNPIELASAIRSMRALPQSALREMGDAALAAYESTYCGDVQIARFERLLRDAAGQPA